MNIDELKKLVKHSTAVLVLDNGEPSFAILGYEAYKDLILGSKEKEKEIKIHHNSGDVNGLNSSENGGFVTKTRQFDEKEQHSGNGINPEQEILERINKDILALKNEIEKEEKTLIANASLD